MYYRKIFKSGNSLVVAVPTEIIGWLDLHRNDTVVLRSTSDRKIIIEKAVEQNIKEISRKDGV